MQDLIPQQHLKSIPLNVNSKFKRKPVTFGEKAKLLLNAEKPDGTSLVDNLLISLVAKAISEGDLAAAKYLIEKSEEDMPTITTQAAVMANEEYDLAQLSIEELKVFRELQIKARKK